MPVLEAHNIEKHFGSTRVLEDISFELERGQALAIIGSSGSGKTTLLRCLNFLETPNQGRILVNGETLFDAGDRATQREGEIRRKRLHFGLVFQSGTFDTDSFRTGLLPLHSHRSYRSADISEKSFRS